MTWEEANEILEDWNLCHYTPSREAAEAVISALDPLEIISALRLVSREQVKKKMDAAIDCIYKIEVDLDRGNDNDWAREHISERKSQKED